MKNKTLLLALCFLLASVLYAQDNVAINTTGAPAHPSAMLDVQSTASGLLGPCMTTLQRDAITSPANGLLIYNLDIGCYEYFGGSGWLNLCGEKEKPLMIPWAYLINGVRPLLNVSEDKRVVLCQYPGLSTMYVVLPDDNLQMRNFTSDWINANFATSGVVIDSALYMLITNSGLTEYRVYKYDLYNINLGGTQVNVLGYALQPTGGLGFMVMASDGSNMYFNFDAGHSVNDYRIAKYSIISFTTFSYQNSVTYGSTTDSFRRIVFDNQGNVYGISQNSTNMIVKYNLGGTFINQTGFYNLGSSDKCILNWNNSYYFTGNAFESYMKFPLK